MEQEAHGPIIIDPRGSRPGGLRPRARGGAASDYSFIHAHKIFEKSKQQRHLQLPAPNREVGLLAGKDQNLEERRQWAKMRMTPPTSPTSRAPPIAT